MAGAVCAAVFVACGQSKDKVQLGSPQGGPQSTLTRGALELSDGDKRLRLSPSGLTIFDSGTAAVTLKIYPDTNIPSLDLYNRRSGAHVLSSFDAQQGNAHLLLSDDNKNEVLELSPRDVVMKAAGFATSLRPPKEVTGDSSLP